jgi:hypothetical protein
MGVVSWEAVMREWHFAQAALPANSFKLAGLRRGHQPGDHQHRDHRDERATQVVDVAPDRVADRGAQPGAEPAGDRLATDRHGQNRQQ